MSMPAAEKHRSSEMAFDSSSGNAAASREETGNSQHDTIEMDTSTTSTVDTPRVPLSAASGPATAALAMSTTRERASGLAAERSTSSTRLYTTATTTTTHAATATTATPVLDAGDADTDTNCDNKEKTTGWLVTSCNVGTAEPQSLSQELERLQVLKSYHLNGDPERDLSFDRLTTMGSNIFSTPYTFLSLVDMGRIWFRCNAAVPEFEDQMTRDLLSCLARVILRNSTVFEVLDMTRDDRFRQQQQQQISISQQNDSTTRNNNNPHTASSSNKNSSPTQQFRFFAGAPLVSPEGYRLGAFCMLDTNPRPQGLDDVQKANLQDLANLAVKSMVDRRKLTTQGEPSHLVACTAHDLITPLTGIQLSLSLLQQDVEFQAKLGEKRQEHLTAAVRSSNMMLRICQSAIETLRGNRKIPTGTDWSLPRNLMQIAEASPFIDMKEFTFNLEAISNSIPKNATLTITMHPSCPPTIVSDGLKIFRSALNLLSNACSRTNSGSINMRIFDDQDGSLVFECEDTGKDIDPRDSQSLFTQEGDTSNFGLYSVAYQINWLGGKFGVRRRDAEHPVIDNVVTTVPVPAATSTPHDSSRSQQANNTGAIFWFSVPIVLPQDVSELMGLAKTLSSEVNLSAAVASGAPMIKAELPPTPPASPLIEEYGYQRHSPTIKAEAVAAGEDGPTRTLNALIIEDSVTVRKILGRALSKLGYQVFEAVDGMEGLRELKTAMFDMVLCDFLMPVMDGLDCVQQYRQWESRNRQVFKQYIVGISAHASKNDIDRGLKLGMNDFKPKPITLKTLTALHESAALRNVRRALDELLNLPSLETRRQSSSQLIEKVKPEGKGATTGDNDKASLKLGLKESLAKTTASPLFSTPASKPKGDEEKNKPALFSITKQSDNARNDGAKKPSPLFSLSGGNLVEVKKPVALFATSTSNAQPDGTKKSGALFTIPTNLNKGEGDAPDGDKKPLFPIPESRSPKGSGKMQKGATKRPVPLFSLPVDSNAIRKTPEAKTKKTPLFSISESQSTAQASDTQATESADSSKSNDSQAKLPLFSLPARRSPTSDSKTETQTVKPAPLFSIATTGDASTKDGAKKPPLFSIPASRNSATSSCSAPSGRKPAPLFSLPTNLNQTSSAKPASKQAPLFSIPSNSTQEDPTKSSKAKAPLFNIDPSSSKTEETSNTDRIAQKAPLFSIPSNPTQNDSKKPAPLFSIATSKDSRAQQNDIRAQQDAERPAPLFSISKTSTSAPANPEERKVAPLFSISEDPRKSDKPQSSKEGGGKPPLFSIRENGAKAGKAKPLLAISTTTSTEQDGNTAVSKKRPLFDIVGKPSGSSDNHGGANHVNAKLQHSSGTQEGEAHANSSPDAGGGDAAISNRPRKVTKRAALFDIKGRPPPSS